MLTSSRWFFAFFLFLYVFSFSQSSTAAITYYWRSGGGLEGADPQYLCSRVQAQNAGSLSPSFKYPSPDYPNNPNKGKCTWTYSSGTVLGDEFTRHGDSCPSPKVWSTTKGICVDPPPPCKVGELFPAKGSVGSVVTDANGRNWVNSQPVDACYNQCIYSAPDARPTGCYGTKGGQGWCNYILKGTGVNCPADSYTLSQSGPPLNPPDTPNVPDSPPDPLCPAGWSVSNGTCFKNPPKVCDPSTGEVCPPGGNGDDGEGNGGNGDDDGDSTNDDSTDDPASDADDDAEQADSEKPDSEGEACKPRADGTGCGGPTVRNEECEKIMECTGDAIQCAILRKQKKMACAYEYKDAKPFIEEQIAKKAYELTTNEVNGAGLFSDGLNAPRWLPSGCPAPKSISIKGVSTSLSFEPACQFARSLAPLFVALAGVFFAVYVGRAFGGS